MTSHMLGLRTTIYKVTDIGRARAWYTSAFGIEPYFDEPFYIGFNIGGYELGLRPDDTSALAKGASVASYWGVEDIKTMYDHLLAIGATAHDPPTNRGGDLMTAEVLDPFGNVLGLIYNPDFKIG